MERVWCYEKKSIRNSTLILTLFFLALSGLIFVSSVTANPVWVGYYPIEPVKVPPEINFQSPIKYQVYDSNFVWLNFTIVKPDQWFLQISDGYDDKGNPACFTFVNITSVNYLIDGVTNTSIPVHDLTRYYEAFPNRSLNFSTNLTLPEGTA